MCSVLIVPFPGKPAAQQVPQTPRVFIGDWKLSGTGVCSCCPQPQGDKPSELEDKCK